MNSCVIFNSITLLVLMIVTRQANGVSDLFSKSISTQNSVKSSAGLRQHFRNNATHHHSEPLKKHWQDIYIAGLFALSGNEIEAAVGKGVMPAIKLALRHLANSSFLHDYRLHLFHNDTEVERTLTILHFSHIKKGIYYT